VRRRKLEKIEKIYSQKYIFSRVRNMIGERLLILLLTVMNCLGLYSLQYWITDQEQRVYYILVDTTIWKAIALIMLQLESRYGLAYVFLESVMVITALIQGFRSIWIRVIGAIIMMLLANSSITLAFTAPAHHIPAHILIEIIFLFPLGWLLYLRIKKWVKETQEKKSVV
jgi:hypothetical protein